MFTYIYPPQSISLSTPPIQFQLDGVDTTVFQDTTAPSNNAALPSLNFFYEDGIQQPVEVDATDPSKNKGLPSLPVFDLDGVKTVVKKDSFNANNSRGLPVEVIGDSIIKFNQDGLTVDVYEDTVTPASSIPLPVKQLDSSGVVISQPLTNTELRATAVPVSAASLPLPSGAATESTLNSVRVGIELIDDTIATDGGAALTKFQAVGGHTGSTSHAWHVDSAGLGRVDVRASVLPTGAATAANQSSELTLIGAVTETAPATDTASSGLNGRLQRIAQRITSLIALIPASLGQNSMANSFAVTLASDQSALSTTQTALVSSYQEITNLTTVAQTFTAPAGAKWCKIYCPDTNVANVRVRLAGTATLTSGIQFQPGRSEDFNAVGNISVIAESGTNQVINVHFGV